jgi:7-carboxy-7-deazaguanine synthase
MYVGVPSVFVRLTGCNLRCEWLNEDNTTTKCDTAYTSFDPEPPIKRAVRDVFNEIVDFKCKHVVITGGEPFLQREVKELIDLLVMNGNFVTVETNGTINLETSANFLSISPKLKSSCLKTSKYYEMHEDNRIYLPTLAKLTENYRHQLKFVVNAHEDIKEIEALILAIEGMTKHSYDQSNIYLMPQGVEPHQFNKMSWIVEEAVRRNWNVTDRLHVRIWGQKRGV